MKLPNKNESVLELAAQWAGEGRKLALATVISTWGSASYPVGSQLIVDSDGRFEGSVSGGCVEPAVITDAFEVISSGSPKRLSFGVSDQQAWDVGMTCGGRMEVYIESFEAKQSVLERAIEAEKGLKPLCLVTELETGDTISFTPGDQEGLDETSLELRDAIFDAIKREICTTCEVKGRRYYIHGIYPSPRLVIIGAVDIGRALAHMAIPSNYSVLIIDPRGAFATEERFPGVELIVEWPDDAFRNITLDQRTAIVALTHDPKIDDPAIEEALRSRAFYIGALGSRKTHADRLERLKIKGFGEDDLKRIHGPVGLDIGAKTHAEIAVSILAEVIKRHRKG